MAQIRAETGTRRAGSVLGSVIVFTFDGLQPSQIAPERMPNVVSILTGMSLGAYGLTANTLVMRDFDDTRVIPAMAPELARVQQA